MFRLFFAAPEWLWLLPVAAVATYWLIRRQRAIGVLQTVMLLLLTLAASRPYISYETAAKKHLLLMEAGADPVNLPKAYADWERREFSGSMAQALLDAGAGMPDAGGTIAVYGGLLETERSLAAALELLHEREIGVTALPAPTSRPARPVLRELHYPASAGVGATVEMQLVMESAEARSVEISLTAADGAPQLHQSLALQAGAGVYRVNLPLPAPGLFQGEIAVDGVACGTVAIEVREAFDAILFSMHSEQEQSMFQQLFGATVRVVPWQEGVKLNDYALVLLGAGMAGKLPPELQRAIAAEVEDGAGVLTLTGREAPFAADAVEASYGALFPVTWEGEQENKLPTVALVIILDTSGSMRGTRIDLARETARLALKNLQETDLAGIVEFHGARRWAAPMQSAANQFSLMRALNRLNAGGGTVILPALEEAYYVLRNTDARLKHVLILTDGGVEYGDFESLIRKMAREDITVSTVMVGPGNSSFLNQLAMWGSGRFFRASSRFALPDLQLRPQGVKPLPPYAEGDFAVAANPEPLLAEWPLSEHIGGLVKSRLADGARRLLSAGDFPLLAVKRSGLGQVAVWNSELNGDWSSGLNRNPAFQATFSALARRLPEALRVDDILAWNRSVNCDLDFEFEAAETPQELTITLTAGTRSQQWRLQPSPAGTFRFRLPNLPEGVYHMHLKDYDLSYPFVARRAPNSSPVPAAIRADAIHAASRPESTPKSTTHMPLTLWLAGLGAVVFLTQLALRRHTRIATLLLLASVFSWSGNAAEYDQAFRAALLCEDQHAFAQAVTAYREAAAMAENSEDRDFALILAWENARRAGTLPELLVEFRTQADVSRPVLAELEDSGDIEGAWELALKQYINTPSPENSDTLLQLAERSGNIGRLEPILPAPGTWPRRQWEIRLALLADRREYARELYTQAIRDTTELDTLLQIAHDASQQAFYQSAEAALIQAMGDGKQRDWPVFFQLVNLYRTTGQMEKAQELLRQMAEEDCADAGALLTAGDLSEQLGNRDAALRFYAASGLEDASMRLAALATQSGEVEKAQQELERLIFSTPTPMRAQQATEQLIETLKASRQLDTYCRELAPRAEAADAPERLVQLYSRSLSATGAHDTLLTFLRSRNQPEQLLHYHLELRQYPEAVALLRQEIARRPENAESYWRKIAMIAVETNDAQLADESLKIQTESGNWEFAGAVQALLGNHNAAAASYEQALRLHPQKSELLLLWANAQKARGQGDEALQLFLAQLPGEESSERFGVLVDGLLNLNAPPPLLESALAEVMKRIAGDPANLFYYQLGEDLAHELGNTGRIRELERLQLAVTPERRSLLLQKLFLDARNRRETPEALFYGRILLAQTERYSPEIYRELGTLLVEEKLFSVAERCAREADRAENANDQLFALAETFQRNRRFAQAERIYQELLRLTPDRLELLTRYAAMLEFQGRYADAAGVNLKALQLAAAPLSDADEKSARGTAHSARQRTFQSIMTAFANQAAFASPKLSATLRKLQSKAPNQTQKQAWASVIDRLARLNGATIPVADKATPKRTPAAPPIPRMLATQLRTLPPSAAVERVAAIFQELPEARREFYWCQLVDAIDFEPAPELSAWLMDTLAGLQVTGSGGDGWKLPVLCQPKLAYAEKALAARPDAPETITLAARMRHLAGAPESARMLAELAYDTIEEQTEYSIPVIRTLLTLNDVYAAAAGEDPAAGTLARDEVIAAREEARRLFGDTPGRLLVLGVLYFGAEKYDQAQNLLALAWEANRNDFALFQALADCVEYTGNWEGWIELLSQRAPTDTTTLILYRMRLIPVLRSFGKWQQARELLEQQNPPLQQQERLLLAHAQGDQAQLEAAFMDYLRSCREDGSSYSLLDQERCSGGILGWRQWQKRFSRNRFAEIAAGVPGCRDYLEYLLAGTLPGEPGFTQLWSTLQALPASSTVAGNPNTLGYKLLMVTAAPERLTAPEREELFQLARQGELPLPLCAAIFRLKTPEEAAEAVEMPLDQYLSAPHAAFDTTDLTPLLELATPEMVAKFCTRLSAIPYTGVRDEVELRRLQLLQRFAPELCRQRRQETAYPADSMLRLLQHCDVNDCEKYLLCSEEYPDWEHVLPLLDDAEAQSRLTAHFATALEQLGAQRHLSQAQLVRHYALLATYDTEERRPLWLEQARKHHDQSSEASLWLLDALVAAGADKPAGELRQKLEAEHKYPKNRQ